MAEVGSARGTLDSAFARWGPAALTFIILAVAGSIIEEFGLPLWTWIAPTAAFGFALAGPRPGWAWPRDAFAALCLLSIFAREFVPPGLSREVTYAFGVPPAAGIGLLFVAYAFGDGIGAGMRRIARGRLGEILRRSEHYGSQLLTLSIEAAGAITILIRPPTPLWWGVLPVAMVAAALFPARWRTAGQAVQVLGCLPLPVLAIGGLLGGWGFVPFTFLLLSLGLTHAIEKLREPIPEPIPSLAESRASQGVSDPPPALGTV